MVTTGVLAAVLAAPVVALWSAHRGGGEDHASAVSSVRVDPTAGPGQRVPVPEPTPVAVLPPVARVATMELAGVVTAETSLPSVQGAAVPVPSHGAAPLSSPALTAEPGPPPSATASRLTVQAGAYGNRTVLTLTNSGDGPLSWHAVLDVDWLRLSRDSGTLEPGQRITVTVTVDEARAPRSRWTAHLALPPSSAVVTLEGGTDHRGVPTPDGPSPDPSPTPTPSASASASASASDPAPASPSPSAPSSPPASSSPPPASPSPSPSAPSGSPDSSGSPGSTGPSAPVSPPP
ncbi:hypothetical protein HUT16_14735 [Kitasatospora sp. NA04385]|uniref:BACON domain-containing protein n=1 Tax=Kitasatospora sp. NA04385 TaxID=2742135 RepID=UPI00158FEED7|nr:hypothetical protein [Kitasatospora sp. NA04385]QKW20154.1 hypothetical protein HUT16_14735 [Kitasatospora sp. NA04385]